MSRGKKIRITAIIVLVALLITTEYKTIYEVAMASPIGQKILGDSVSDNSSEEAVTEQTQPDTNQEQTPTDETEDGTSLVEENSNTQQDNQEQNETKTEGIADDGVQLQFDGETEAYGETETAEEDMAGAFVDGTISENSVDVAVSANELEEVDRVGGDTSEIPTIVNTDGETIGFVEWYNSKPDNDKRVHISNYADWQNFQIISTKMDLKDYVFQIDNNQSSAATDSGLYTLGGSVGFTGIGSEEFPFRGTLTCYLESGMNIVTSVPIFNYLSTESSLSNLHIYSNGYAGTSAALAAHVIEYKPKDTAENVTGVISLSNIKVSGKMSNASGVAAGLFGEIRNNSVTPLTISVKTNNAGVGVAFDVDKDGNRLILYGLYTGAIAGIVSGNVQFEYDAAKYDLTNIQYMEGSIPSDSAVNTFMNSTCIDMSQMDVLGAGGLLFGLVMDSADSNGGQYKPVITLKSSDSTVDTIKFQIPRVVDANGKITAWTGIRGYGIHGGLIGYLRNATLDASAQKVVVEGVGIKGAADIIGSVKEKYKTSGVGGVIGVMENSSIASGSAFQVENMCVYHQAVYSDGGYKYIKGLGGFFGSVIDSTIPVSQDDKAMFTMVNCYVSGMNSGVCYGAGGFAGFYSDTKAINNTISGIDFTHVRVQTQEASEKEIRPSVGTMIGLYKAQNGNTLTISDWSLQGFFATANKGNGTGGVVGCAEASEKTGTIGLKIMKGEMDSRRDLDTKIVNTYMGAGDFLIWDDYNQTGGVIGITKNVNCELSDIHMKGLAIRSYVNSGGMIGEVTGTTNKKHIYLSNITIDLLNQSCNTNVSTNGYGAKGLLFGKVGANTIVKLDGKMDFSETKWYWCNKTENQSTYHLGTTYYGDKTPYVGTIAGIQEQAVIYIDCKDADEEFKPYTYDSSDTNASVRMRYVDEIGNFGGAYRNIKAGTDYVFNDDEVTGTIEAESGSYQLKSEADLMRFAVVMNSEGAFGTKCFEESSSDCSTLGSECYQNLLGANYVLTSTQYDLSNTGIVSLQRTVGQGTSAMLYGTTIPEALTKEPAQFTGSFSGSSEDAKAEIIHNISVYRHQNQGLFANIGSDSDTPAKFENLKLTESIIPNEFEEALTNNTGFNALFDNGSKGGLSVFATGNVLVNNCELNVGMKSHTYSGTDQKDYYGGLFGKYVANAGSSLTVSNVIAKGAKTVRDNDHYVSQLIACVESPVKPATLPKIEMSNITISGSVENTKATDTCYLGGLIAVMNENTADGSLSPGTDEPSWKDGYESWHDFTHERTQLMINGLTVSDFAVTNSSTAYRSSGLLGFRWLAVNAQLTNILVGEADKANTLQTNKRFGGLLNEVSGRMDVQRATIQNTAMTNTNTVDCSSIFVAEAEYLYLTVTDYVVKDTTTVERSENKYFDEVAGHTKQSSRSSSGKYSYSESKGGVVSIATSEKDKSLVLNDTEPYNSYKNGAVYTINGASIDAKEVENVATRYYYDISVIMQNPGDLTDKTIDSPEELMRWHFLQYVRTDLRSYFFTEAESKDQSDVRKQPYTISGAIDLNGYSYYPTTIDERTITGADDAKIIFHAQEIIDKEDAEETRYRQPYDDVKQHYMLHGGLFHNVTASTISDLTLSGTVAEMEHGYSGGLVCGSILGKSAKKDEDVKAGYLYSTQKEDYTNISNITLSDLWIAKKGSGEWSGHSYGLMVASIFNGAKVNFSKIKMTDYDVSKIPTRESYAARALIGVVGTYADEAAVTESEFKLSFVDMDIADVADKVNLSNAAALPSDLKNATDNDKVLHAASLICYYNYYEDSSSAIYTFTKADYLKGKGLECESSDPDKDLVDLGSSAGYITMGNEIDADTEYIDENISTKIQSDMYGFNNNHYKPYVYKSRPIIVNPKPGHITEGCGTYEDPYVIRTDKQFKSLYFYLKDQTEQLINWKLNPVGDDKTLCGKSHSESEVKTYGVDDDFPTKEQLNQAYYIIDPKADTSGNRTVDLSSCSDFVGLGSSTDPFIGVIVGKKAENGSMPVIKLPGYVNNGQDVDSYGLVRYAKGCVVKDLTLELGTTKSVDNVVNTYYAGVKDAGAGVIGDVCGGDNVIDNVIVKGSLKASASTGDNGLPTAQIGGYVGCIDLGSVILRNITAESLNDFEIVDASGKTVVGNASYMWTGGIIGRVKDGTAVYEGLVTSTGSQPIVGGNDSVAGFAYQNTAGLKASPNYGIINAQYLTNCGNVSTQLDFSNSLITISPNNAGQLLLTSMALNSGSLSYVGMKETELGFRNGYGADSRCRNGQYGTVGSATDESDTDYLDAVKNENLNGKQPSSETDNLEGSKFYTPYLLDYFDVSVVGYEGNVVTGGDVPMAYVLFCGIKSPTYNDSNTYSCYTVMPADWIKLEFAENQTYDMTVLEDSFRGVGAGYFNTFNAFKGSVDGNNSTINLNYISNASKEIDNIGLFNTVIIRSQDKSCYMKDLTITGKLLNADVVSNVSTLTSDLLNGDSITGKTAAGLIGRLEIESSIDPSNFTTPYNYSFENIQVKDMDVETQEYAGGLIGRIVSTPEGGANSSYKNALNFDNCVVGSLDNTEGNEGDEPKYNVTLKGRADVGGIIASYQDSLDVTLKKCQVQSVDLQACGKHLYQIKDGTNDAWLNKKVYPSAGGFIGRGVGTGKTITVLGGGYNQLNLKSRGHMGGVIGETESSVFVNGSQDDDTEYSFVGDSITFSGIGGMNEISITDTNWIETTLASDGTIDTNAANYNRTKFLGSFGGLIGFVADSGVTVYDTAQNKYVTYGTTVNNVTLTNIIGTINYGQRYETFMGGLIGRLYQTGNAQYAITDCTIGSTESSLRLVAKDDPDSDKQRMVITGGLVGDIECAGTTQITNCSVIGNGDGSSTLQGTESAAGMNGLVYTYTKTGQNVYYDKCSVKNLNINGYLRTGGIEAKRDYNTKINYPYETFSIFYDVHVSNCELYTYFANEFSNPDGLVNLCSSGGLQGYTSGRTKVVACSVQNVSMDSYDVDAAGGLIGKTGGYYACPSVAKTSVTDCTIVGACAGGIAGYVGTSLNETRIVTSEVEVKNNKIISYNVDEKTYLKTDYIQYAGGLIGHWENNNYTFIGSDVLIENNLIGLLPARPAVILGWSYVGGLAGKINCGAKIKTVELKNNIVSILDKEKVFEDAKQAADETTDEDGLAMKNYLKSDAFGIWSTGTDGKKTVDPDRVANVAYPRMVCCYKADGATAATEYSTKLEEYRQFANQNDTLPYLQASGMMFGLGNQKQVWITAANVSYDTDMKIYRPATDVGISGKSNAINSYRYGCHIVYGKNEQNQSTIDETNVDNESIAKAMGIDIEKGEYYQFGDLLKLWDGYQNEADKKFAYLLGADSNGNYYQGTHYKTTTSIDEILSGTYYDKEQKYRSIYTNAEGKVIPMLVYDNNEAGLDVTINTILAVLTNNGGLLTETNATDGSITSVSTFKMVVNEGVVSKATDTSHQPSITATQKEQDTINSIPISVRTIICDVNSAGYDVQTDSKNGTFTVLRVEYKWKNGNNTIDYKDSSKEGSVGKYISDSEQTMIIDIPIYLEKVLEYQTHVTGVQGAEYYLDNLLTNGKNNLLSLRDTYTAYVEYVYNDAYDKYNSKLTKEIVFEGTDVKINKGTRFVLIDLSNNGHAYYYKAETDKESVPLSDFKDSGGTAYAETAIKSLTSRTSDKMNDTLYLKHEDSVNQSMPGSYYATQQYIILVDCSEMVNEVANYAYQFVVQPIERENETLLRRSIQKTCPQELPCNLVITEYQGITGKFDETNTQITGEISPESNVTIDLDYTISASETYWNYVKSNEGSFLSQYLDVAIYLDQNGNRVALPTGTQVIFNKGTEKQVVGVMQGNTILYQYKDAGTELDLNQLNTSTRFEAAIELDFSNADFVGFNSGEYNVVLELLKTKDADFPMGGDVLDTYKLTVKSTAKKNLGFALEPKDLLTLGMNGYLPEESDSGVIDYDMRIDFSDYFNGSGIASSEMKALKDKYFTVEYSIEKKVKDENGKLSYEPYNGDLVKVYFGDSQKENIGDGSKVVYKFSEDYIKSGEGEDKYVVSFPYTVKADVKQLLAQYDTITNYRVVAKLYLSDSMPTGASETLATESTDGCDIYVSPGATIESTADGMEDFFIFTVAKIKTDLDITQ